LRFRGFCLTCCFLLFFVNFRQNARKRNCSFIAELEPDGKFSIFWLPQKHADLHP
jgi:hypothetical protein